MVPVWHIQPYLSVICSGVFRLGRRSVLSLSLSRHFSPVQERALVRATKLDTRFRFLSHESCRLLCNQTRHAPVQFFTGKRLTRERKPWRVRAKLTPERERALSIRNALGNLCVYVCVCLCLFDDTRVLVRNLFLPEDFSEFSFTLNGEVFSMPSYVIDGVCLLVCKLVGSPIFVVWCFAWFSILLRSIYIWNT